MDVKNQFTYFCLTVIIGFAWGLIYELFSVFRFVFGCDKNKTIGVALDVLFCITLALGYTLAAFLLRFPDFRIYMFVGIGLGFTLYLKSLHRIVAFFEKVCYNNVRKLINKVKKAKNSIKE